MNLFSYPSFDNHSLSIIQKVLPDKINNYYEPFFGSDCLLKTIKFKRNIQGKSVLNCQSTSLYNLWIMIAKKDKDFLNYVEKISTLLIQSYVDSRLDNEVKALTSYINQETSDLHVLSHALDSISEIMVQTNLTVLNALKISGGSLARNIGYNILDYLSKVQKQKKLLDHRQIILLIETALKKAIFDCLKALYNYPFQNRVGTYEFVALYYYLQMTGYPFKYRFNDKGSYTCPYGGRHYNRIDLREQLKFISSPNFSNEFSNTIFSPTDYSNFLSYSVPKFSQNDFIFLMPPVATVDTCYNQNTFNSSDERKLSYLLKKFNTKYLLLIHKTPTTNMLFANSYMRVKEIQIAYQFEPNNHSGKKVQYLLVSNY